jgi:hypothetical protein
VRHLQEVVGDELDLVGDLVAALERLVHLGNRVDQDVPIPHRGRAARPGGDGDLHVLALEHEHFHLRPLGQAEERELHQRPVVAQGRVDHAGQEQVFLLFVGRLLAGEDVCVLPNLGVCDLPIQELCVLPAG